VVLSQQPIGCSAPQGTQAGAFTANTIIVDLPLQSSHKAPSLPQTNQATRDLRLNEQQIFDDQVAIVVELAHLWQETKRLRQQQENITRRRVVSQHAQAMRQQVRQERICLAELQQTINILHQ
jgi:hypothetical protein